MQEKEALLHRAKNESYKMLPPEDDYDDVKPTKKIKSDVTVTSGLIKSDKKKNIRVKRDHEEIDDEVEIYDLVSSNPKFRNQ